MPLYGPNKQQGLPSNHEWFEQWEAKGVKTMRFFLEPVILTINLALRSGYTRVVMMGKSGGGWTTTLAAALDPRISFSAPVAGSIPLTFPHKSWDYEQEPRPSEGAGWYLGACNYTCLYTRRSSSRGATPYRCCTRTTPAATTARGGTRGSRRTANVSAALAATGAAHGGFSMVVSNWNVHAVCQMDRLLLRRRSAASPPPLLMRASARWRATCCGENRHARIRRQARQRRRRGGGGWLRRGSSGHAEFVSFAPPPGADPNPDPNCARRLRRESTPSSPGSTCCAAASVQWPKLRPRARRRRAVLLGCDQGGEPLVRRRRRTVRHASRAAH